MTAERPEGRGSAPEIAPPSSTAASVTWAPPPPPPPPAPGSVPGKRRNRALVWVAVAAALMAGAAIGVPLGLLTRGSQPTPAAAVPSSSAAGGATTVQARALYAQALAAMRGSAGFHYVSASTGGAATQTIVGDAGPSGGRQVITIDAPIGTEQFTLILVSGTVYFEGNTPALEDQLGVPAANAPSLQRKWVSVSNRDGPYGIVAPGITIADEAQETALVPASTASIGKVGGAGATRILGAVPPQQSAPGGTGHLDIAASTARPISYVSTVSVSGVAVTSTTTFTGWGTAPVATIPTGAVAWSTLGASAPPGGYGSGGGGLGPSATPQI